MIENAFPNEHIYDVDHFESKIRQNKLHEDILQNGPIPPTNVYIIKNIGHKNNKPIYDIITESDMLNDDDLDFKQQNTTLFLTMDTFKNEYNLETSKIIISDMEDCFIELQYSNTFTQNQLNECERIVNESILQSISINTIQINQSEFDNYSSNDDNKDDVTYNCIQFPNMYVINGNHKFVDNLNKIQFIKFMGCYANPNENIIKIGILSGYRIFNILGIFMNQENRLNNTLQTNPSNYASNVQQMQMDLINKQNEQQSLQNKLIDIEVSTLFNKILNGTTVFHSHLPHFTNESYNKTILNKLHFKLTNNNQNQTKVCIILSSSKNTNHNNYPIQLYTNSTSITKDINNHLRIISAKMKSKQNIFIGYAKKLQKMPELLKFINNKLHNKPKLTTLVDDLICNIESLYFN